jgi:hypothetical protein
LLRHVAPLLFFLFAFHRYARMRAIKPGTYLIPTPRPLHFASNTLPLTIRTYSANHRASAL